MPAARVVFVSGLVSRLPLCRSFGMGFDVDLFVSACRVTRFLDRARVATRALTLRVPHRQACLQNFSTHVCVLLRGGSTPEASRAIHFSSHFCRLTFCECCFLFFGSFVNVKFVSLPCSLMLSGESTYFSM